MFMSDMKRLLFFIMLCVVALSSSAQQKKWKAPKRPKVKWELPKQKEQTEVIDVWRPYSFADNIFFDLHGGMSIPFAENKDGHNIIDMCAPVFELSVGKQTSRVWSSRLSFSYARQYGWADASIVENYQTQIGEGRFKYKMVTGFFEEQLSLVNWIGTYNERRRFDMRLFAGVGFNYSFGFEKKVKSWEKYGCEIEATDHVNVDLRGGAQFLYKVGNAVDLSLQGTYSIVGDSFNGQKHSDKFVFDPYVNVELGVRVHLMDQYGDFRYKKVSRRESNSLRGQVKKVDRYIGQEKERMLRDKERSEVVAYGELMKTHVAFYIDRTYVNDEQMENLRIVAGFMKSHPEVKLMVKGYSGASRGVESPSMNLAEKRVEAVRKVMLRNFNIDKSRFDIWYDEEAVAPFGMNGEWIDAVVFEMVESMR